MFLKIGKKLLLEDCLGILLVVAGFHTGLRLV